VKFGKVAAKITQATGLNFRTGLPPKIPVRHTLSICDDGKDFVARLVARLMSPDVQLVVDGLPAHKKALVKDYVASTAGKLTLHFLPGYAPDLNPDEMVWSHAKRTEMTRSPLKAGEKLQCRVHAQLQDIANDPALVKSFFRHPSVSYITDL
jgi:hypothetical protein